MLILKLTLYWFNINNTISSLYPLIILKLLKVPSNIDTDSPTSFDIFDKIHWFIYGASGSGSGSIYP